MIQGALTILLLVGMYFWFTWEPEKTMKINVPSDSKALYFDEGLEMDSNGFIQIHTQRVGPSGFSHAVRIVDCESQLFDYVYDHDSKPDEFPILTTQVPTSELVQGSISYWVSGYACRSLGKSTAGW